MFSSGQFHGLLVAHVGVYGRLGTVYVERRNRKNVHRKRANEKARRLFSPPGGQ